MTSRGRPTHRIFISADAGTDLSSIRALVHAGGMEAVSWEELPPTTLLGAIGAEIERCDGVVGVVGDRGMPASVMVEIGAALGLGKPVVLVSRDRSVSRRIPAVLAGLPLVLTGGDIAATGSRLADALTQPTIAANDLASPRRERVDKFVDEVAARGWADTSERDAAHALAGLGARVVAQSPANSRGQVDLAVWIDSAPGREINPVLIEVAGRNARDEDKIAQLRTYLLASQSIIGLVVMRENREPRWNVESGTAVAVVGLEWLRNATSQEFIRLLTHGRNQLVHGSP